MQKSHYLLSALHVLNLLCEAKSLIRIITGSSSSKLLSRLILLRFTLRIPISIKQNVTSPESSSKNSKPSSSYKAVESFLIILLLTNQLRISFSAARQSSTGSSDIL